MEHLLCFIIVVSSPMKIRYIRDFIRYQLLKLQFILKFIFQNLTILFTRSLLFKIKIIICNLEKEARSHTKAIIIKIKINFLNVKYYNYDIYYKFHHIYKFHVFLYNKIILSGISNILLVPD